jgi:spermidine synthase
VHCHRLDRLGGGARLKVARCLRRVLSANSVTALRYARPMQPSTPPLKTDAAAGREEGASALAAVSPAEVALLAGVFVVAACGLVYELAAGALASYLLGDSVLQFSTVIGCYLFAMGIGSWASRFVEQQLVAQFLRIELLVGLIGGLMPAGLFIAHSLLPAGATAPFRVLLYALVGLVGVLVGLEIPLVMRILKRQFSQRYALKELVSQVLTFDYLGALVVALAFPLLFVPHLGLVRTGLFFGLLNAGVAVWALWLFRGELRRWRAHALACVAVVAALLGAMAGADRLTTWAEDGFYGQDIILRESSDYQRVVVTAGPAGVRLFLNGNLQFHSRDEYRYHEALVHPVMSAGAAGATPRRVLVLGGGDGLAVREVLKYPSVQAVTLVELDPHMTRLFARHPALMALNQGALANPKVTVVNADAYAWLESSREMFDAIVIDFPDPTNFALGKLYTTSFYQRAEQRLAASGYMVVQTTSPLVARKSFWTVASTLEAVGLQTTPYHAHVPSFGEWGFIIAGRRPWVAPSQLPQGLRFLTLDGLPALLSFPPDMARVPAEPNRLSNQLLVTTFEREWGRVQR